MKYSSILSLIFIVLALTGCTLVTVEKYIYKESSLNSGVTTEETYWNEVIYSKGSYKFFPRFYTLSKSYSGSSSRITIYSTTQNEIYLNKIVLESSSGKHKDEIVFEKLVPLEKFDAGKGQNFIGLPLFSESNTDLSKYWNSGDIIVTLVHRDGSGLQDKNYFEFKLWRGREIAWPT